MLLSAAPYKKEFTGMIYFSAHIHKTSGPVFMKNLSAKVAPSNKILRKFLEMWVFPLKFKEKILVKTKVIQKAS